MRNDKASSNRLALALRALFTTLLRPQPDVEPAASPSPAADGMKAAGAAPAERLSTSLVPVPASDTPRMDDAMRQPGFFEPADPPGDQSQGLVLADFVARLHDAMRRAGVTARDPLQPVLIMLGEMLLHFFRLQADQAAASRHITTTFTTGMREEGARAQAAIARDSMGVADAMADCANRIEAGVGAIRLGREDVQKGFRSDVEAALRTYTRARTRRERVTTAAIGAVAAVALVGAGVWYGQSSERETMKLAILGLRDPIFQAAMRDGKEVAHAWLNMMTWNHYDTLSGNCAPQVSGSGYRLACAKTFWAAPPLIEPPSPR